MYFGAGKRAEIKKIVAAVQPLPLSMGGAMLICCNKLANAKYKVKGKFFERRNTTLWTGFNDGGGYNFLRQRLTL
jgi:hypothetical protein